VQPANWTEQGPMPILNGRDVTGGANAVSGAIEAIAIDTTDPNHDTVYVGSVNGGVWKTTGLKELFWPTLTISPSMDQAASLSISALAVSQQHSSILYAGTGNLSNGGAGGRPVGVLKSTDGGTTWQLVGGKQLDGLRVNRIVLDSNDDTHVLAAV